MESKNLFTVEGIIKTIFETQVVSDKFRKREFVLEINDGSPYTQLVKFELTQERTVKLDLMKSGEQVSVQFQLKGREWVDPQGQKKFFTTLNVMDVQPLLNDAGKNRVEDDFAYSSPPPSALPEDDLPF